MLLVSELRQQTRLHICDPGLVTRVFILDVLLNKLQLLLRVGRLLVEVRLQVPVHVEVRSVVPSLPCLRQLSLGVFLQLLFSNPAVHLLYVLGIGLKPGQIGL